MRASASASACGHAGACEEAVGESELLLLVLVVVVVVATSLD